MSFLGLGTFLVSFGFLYFGLQSLATHRLRTGAKNSPTSKDALLQSDAAKHYKQKQQQQEKEKVASASAGPLFSLQVKLLVAVFSAFLFMYVGIEYCVGMYLATFAVQSDLKVGLFAILFLCTVFIYSGYFFQATRVEGAELTALFWGSFAMMRFLAIFAAMKIKPIYTISFSFVICIVGSTSMMIYGQSSFQAMQVRTYCNW